MIRNDRDERQQQEAVFWLLQKHRLERIVPKLTCRSSQAIRDSLDRCEVLAPYLPETSFLIDQCRQHYALIARKELVSMTLDSRCPVVVGRDLLAALVALADRDPAKILRAYSSRLCFYCDSQSDPSMRDQVEEVGGMMRALEHFTRVLFLGGDDDRCVQFLYADLSSETLGTAPFASHLSEEDLNGLLCGRKDYPHVAQLVNGCLPSRLGSVRRSAYETLANVALFAKAHRGPKAFDMLLRTRLRGVEKDPRLVVVLAALVWEVVFVDEELQEERLLGSGVPGSGCKGLLDDLFADSTEVRLVAFYSVARLLFHSWIPAAVENNGHQKEQPNRHKEEKYWLSDNGDQTEEEEEEKAEGEGEEEGEELELFERTSPSSATATRCSTTPTAITPLTPACAEHALLRVSLILHEPGPTRRFDSRVRTTCRCLAKRLRSRKRGARHLLARAVLLLVDHGLANGSLDGLRGHFPPALRERRELRALDSSAMSVCSGDGDESDHPYDFADDDGGGDAVCTDGTVEHPRGSEYGSSYGGGRDRNRYAFRQGNMTEGRVQENGEGCGEREEGLGKDAFQYAAAVHFLVEMLSKGDQTSVVVAMESRLRQYFHGGDDVFWGDDWFTGGDGINREDIYMDTRAAAVWLMAGAEDRRNGVGEA